MESAEKQAELLQQLIDENRQLMKELGELKAAAAAKKKVEFAKLIFWIVSALTVSVTVFSCRMIWITMDTSALAYLIPAVFAEMTAATAFYYTKAKVENKIKLMAAYKVKPEASDFNGY